MKILIHCANFPKFPEVKSSHRKLDTSHFEVDWLYTLYNPFEPQNWQRNVSYKFAKARTLTLEGGYDYLFNVESDLVLPSNALCLLMKEFKPVISGLYRLRPEHTGTDAYAARIWDVPGPQAADDRYIRIGEDFEYGDVLRCTFVGFGCLLIHKKVLSSVDLAYYEDTTFCKACEDMDIPVFVHTGVRCVHIGVGGKRYPA